MLTADHSWQGLPSSSPNTTTLAQLTITPLLAIATLLLSCLAFGEPMDGAYLILALLVFPLTFFGQIPSQGPRRREIAADILTNWLAIVALLLMLGWITRTLDFFDQRVMLAWILTTPLALMAGQLLFPVFLPKLMAVESVRRVAVIALFIFGPTVWLDKWLDFRGTWGWQSAPKRRNI